MIVTRCIIVLIFISLMRIDWVVVTFSFISLAARCALTRTRSLLGPRVLRILLIVILMSFICWERAMTTWMAQALPLRITLHLMVATWDRVRRRRLLHMRVDLTRSYKERIWFVVDNKNLGRRHYELSDEFIYWLAAIGLDVKGIS